MSFFNIRRAIMENHFTFGGVQADPASEISLATTTARGEPERPDPEPAGAAGLDRDQQMKESSLLIQFTVWGSRTVGRSVGRSDGQTVGWGGPSGRPFRFPPREEVMKAAPQTPVRPRPNTFPVMT